MIRGEAPELPPTSAGEAAPTFPPPDPAPTLTYGIVRNAFFNLVGWVFPLVLAIVAVPVIVAGLGVNGYGVFSILGVLTGYLGVVNTPATQGGIRFMAEAYALRDWPRLRGLLLTSLALSSAISLLGSLILVFAAGPLVELFNVPEGMVATSVVAVRIAAVAFLINGINQALAGVLSAVRRFALLNLLAILSKTAMTVGIMAAVWLGGGLLGAIEAQVLTSFLALLMYGLVILTVARRLSPDRSIQIPPGSIRKLGTFSAMLFAGAIGATLGVQLDRGLVGVVLGPAAVAFYAIPVRLTDGVLGLLSSFAQLLYPLSSEASASAQLDRLRRLYMQAARFLAWLGAFFSSCLIVASADVLAIWVGRDIAEKSWMVLALLAACIFWRGPSSVAHRVCNGMGRADVAMRVSYAGLACTALPILLLMPKLGVNGAALGMLIGTIPINVAYDLFVQRRLLSQQDWSKSLALYWKPLVPLLISTVVCAQVHPLHEWTSIAIKLLIVSCVFGGSVLLERDLMSDLVLIWKRVVAGLRLRLSRGARKA